MEHKKLLLSSKLFTAVMCLVAIDGFSQTVNLTYTGAVQTITVPACVDSIMVDMAGAQGGGNGGNGGRVQCTYPCSGGTVLNIYVGGVGGPMATNSPGGFNGGGNSGTFTAGSDGSGGGGASDIRIGGTALTNRVIVAGGGGGINLYNGNPGAGGDTVGGNSISTGNTCMGIWATGGSQTAGGLDATTSGSCCFFTVTPNGTLGIGGDGSGPSTSCNGGDAGGGGGGGYYGGGGGGGYSSGAGGSSYTDPTCREVMHTQGYQASNGYVNITMMAATPPVLTIGTNVIGGASICAGSADTLTANITGTSPFTYSWSTGGTNSTVLVTSASKYVVQVTDKNGCVAKDSVTITVNSLPTVTMSAAKDTQCVTITKDTLIGNPSGGTFIGTGVTGSNFNANVAGTGAHKIMYTYTDINGCTNVDSLVLTVNACTGIDEVNSLDNEVKFYPNPFSNSMSITIDIDGPVNISLLNTLGENLGTWQATKGLNNIDTQGIAAGVYTLQIKTAHGVLNKKVVKVD